MRADAFAARCRHAACMRNPRAVRYRRGDATDAALASTAGTEVRRFAQRYETRPERALSPPVLGRRCGVNCPEGQFNITGCCTHARRSARQAHSRRACAQPPLCLAPLGLRGHRLGVPSPCPPNTDARAHPAVPAAQITESGAASGAVMVLAPPGHPSAPGGLPGFLHCPCPA